jgi:AraC family transcriptional regulator, regulatory protein of adaptative response / methylated-DNA-[protein]-cysteine methyltransferase
VNNIKKPWLDFAQDAIARESTGKIRCSKAYARRLGFLYSPPMSTLPPVQTMSRALLGRDAAFDGVFYVGVKTTGVFCRPTCPAKKPKSEKVEYYASPQAALYGGYRPCSRCRPLDKDSKPPELVSRLRELVERSSTGKVSGAELRSAGIDSSTARRQFQRYCGMTFHAFQRARRMGLALREVRHGASVIDAQLSSGFESASGFWEAFTRAFGVAPSRAQQVNCFYARWLETPLGAMLALANDQGIHLLEFVDRRGLEREIACLMKRARGAVVPGDNPHLDQLAVELKSYFDRTFTDFTVPLVVAGSKFECDVWSLLRTIPPGETRSYTQLAQTLGRPQATRAVGRANGRNCLALLIPCHRVIRADGNLCGYGGGVWRKQWLLEHETKALGGGRSALG